MLLLDFPKITIVKPIASLYRVEITSSLEYINIIW